MKMKMVAGVLICVSAVASVGSSTFAGEVTGGGQGGPNGDGKTGMRGHAQSDCGFSGIEDEPDLTDGVAPGTPDGAIGHRRLTQTPHLVWVTPEEFPWVPEPGMWLNPPAGSPGTACSPGRPVEE